MKVIAPRSIVGAIVVAMVVIVGCSSSKHSATFTEAPTTATAPVPTTQSRPAGPAAQLTPLSGGNGVFMGEGTKPDLAAMGYVEHEYAASGTATAYTMQGERTADGRWSLHPSTKAAYRTRVLVRAPKDPAKFSGNVIVEWLNVSGGVDANPDWASLQEEIVRAGDVWVGVSAQRIGVEGGPVLVSVSGIPGAEVAGKGLKAIDPARYGSLNHPGDGYAYDIFTQAARAARAGTGLGGLQPKRVIAAGESQSAFALVTYYNGVQPLTHAFDGFFVHSRGSGGLGLGGGTGTTDAESSIAGAIGAKGVIFRTDQAAPIMDIQTETDVASILNSYSARQPDSKTFRLWEVAGTAHADAHLVGASASSIKCGVPINNGDMHLVAKAALRALTAWLTQGTPPVVAPRLTVKTVPKVTIVRNADGIALGGIRTPPVDVPVATLSGAPGPVGSTICLLLGSTKPFTAARIAELYPSRAEYVKQYTAAADKTITSGFALPQDRAALLAYADPELVGK